MIAAAGALGSARRGGRGSARSGALSTPDQHTLLITLDRLAPMSDRLGVFRDRHHPVAVSPGVHLLALDRLTLLEEMWGQFTAVLGDTLARSKIKLPGVAPLVEVDPGELATLPGIEDFLLLRRVRDEAVSGQWKRIVLDCSGVGDPFALLRSASVLHQGLDRFWPRHRRIAASAERPALAALTAAVDSIDTDCTDVAELLTDATTTAVSLVIGVDDRGARLLPHHLAAVDAMGLALRSVHLNTGVSSDLLGRLGDGGVPPHPPLLDDLCAVLADDEQAGIAVRVIGPVDGPIDRAARVRKLGVTLDAPSGRAHGSSSAVVESVGGTGLDSVYEMRWRQRLPDAAGFALGRVGDDLLVTVDGFRHPVLLPSVLRRCVVRDARFDGGVLVVVFTPDPAVWPIGR